MSLRGRRSWDLARYAGLTIFAIPWIVVPIWLVLVNSFKQAGEAASLDLSLPSVWSFVDNYTTVLVQGNYSRALANSLLISVPTIFSVVLIGAAAAWGFGRSRSKLMQFGYYVIALSILIPPSLIPTIYLLRDLSLDGTTLGYILVLVGTRMGVVVFLATGFVRATPTDIEDAACMDGARSATDILFLIMLPLLAPVLFVGSVILPHFGLGAISLFRHFPAAGTHARHAAARALLVRYEFGPELPLEPGLRPCRAFVAAAGYRLCLHPATRHRRPDEEGALKG